MVTTYKTGKTPARPGAVKLQLSSYVDLSALLPKIPSLVGLDTPEFTGAGMLGNDQYGDCVLAGGDHEEMKWNLEAGKTVNFTPETALSDYAAITGFNPVTGAGDNGTDIQKAASYRQKVGLLDANGERHKVGAYLALKPGNLDELRAGIYLFGAVGIGWEFPDYWMDEFNEGKEWTYRSGVKPTDGHYTPAFASASKNGVITVATWAKLQKASAASYRHFNDESIVYLSVETLNGQGETPEGFNLAQLQADLKSVQSLS